MVGGSAIDLRLDGDSIRLLYQSFAFCLCSSIVGGASSPPLTFLFLSEGISPILFLLLTFGAMVPLLSSNMLDIVRDTMHSTVR